MYLKSHCRPLAGGWRKLCNPTRGVSRPASLIAEERPRSNPSRPSVHSVPLPHVEPAALAHFLVVRMQLDAEATAPIDELDSAQLRSLIERVAVLPIPDAVDAARSFLAASSA